MEKKFEEYEFNFQDIFQDIHLGAKAVFISELDRAASSAKHRFIGQIREVPSARKMA